MYSDKFVCMGHTTLSKQRNALLQFVKFVWNYQIRSGSNLLLCSSNYCHLQRSPNDRSSMVIMGHKNKNNIFLSVKSS
uniref:Uncharacterized protein n=1 Tax=Pararge aegeria TaxID=116150 RepID=S4PXD7_9NEOP